MAGASSEGFAIEQVRSSDANRRSLIAVMDSRSTKTAATPSLAIAERILIARGHRVLLDRDLAELYEVETKVLVQAVKRNLDRFPSGFMFQLTNQEFANLRSQSVTSSWGGRRYARRYPNQAGAR